MGHMGSSRSKRRGLVTSLVLATLAVTLAGTPARAQSEPDPEAIVRAYLEARASLVLDDGATAALRSLVADGSPVADRETFAMAGTRLAWKEANWVPAKVEVEVDIRPTGASVSGAYADISAHVVTWMFFKDITTGIEHRAGVAEDHRILLRAAEGAWVVERDDYFDDCLAHHLELAGAPESLVDEAIAQLEAAADNAGVLETPLEPPLETSTSVDTGFSLPVPLATTYEYDRLGAVDYAHAYWDDYNDAQYYDHTDQGGDCANFCSQVMHSGGGYPRRKLDDRLWEKGWWMLKDGTDNHSLSWVTCTTQNKAWYTGKSEDGTSLTPTYTLGSPTGHVEGLFRGDYIYYDWDPHTHPGLNHVATVTARIKGGDGVVRIYVTCHTTDRYDWFYSDIVGGNHGEAPHHNWRHTKASVTL